MTADDDLHSETSIRELLSVYGQALNASDAALAVSCYAPDGVFMPTMAPTAAGADLLAAYEQIFATIALNVEFTIDELVVAGHVAYALTRSQGTQTVLASGQQTPEANREVFVFALEADDWKISRYMFNKSE